MRRMKILFLTVVVGLFIGGSIGIGIAGGLNSNGSMRGWPYHAPCPSWRWSQGQQVHSASLKGTVTTFSPPIAILKTKRGEVYMRVGPWWFWRGVRYKIKTGDRIEVQGYMFGDYVVPSKIITDSGEIVLRDRYGFPLWRGGWRHRWNRGCCQGQRY